VISRSIAVKPIEWCRATRVGRAIDRRGIDISNDALIIVSVDINGIGQLVLVHGIEVVSEVGMIESVERHSLGLLVWEDIARYCLGGIA